MNCREPLIRGVRALLPSFGLECYLKSGYKKAPKMKLRSKLKAFFLGRRPRVSVVIMSYNMAREVPRTVHSFLPPYQQGLSPEDVEILVLENGSSAPVPQDIRASWPSSVRYFNIEDAHPSPAKALNHGVRLARSRIVCPVIDGARMASPGLLKAGLDIAERDDNAFVATLSFHLGEKLQQIAVTEGYNQQVEDELIRGIGWPANGYRLFEIAAPGGSSKNAWFGTISESNSPILSKRLFRALGGFDERFDIPGGGFVNLDFLTRAISQQWVKYYLIVGEATFHQFHGGVTTSRHVQKREADGETTYSKYAGQYKQLRGVDYKHPERKPTLYGTFTAASAEIAAVGIGNYIEELEERRRRQRRRRG